MSINSAQNSGIDSSRFTGILPCTSVMLYIGTREKNSAFPSGSSAHIAAITRQLYEPKMRSASVDISTTATVPKQ